MNRTRKAKNVEFSSSDDDELEQQLRQQVKQTIENQRGIIRADPIKEVALVQGGQTVRVRKGTIFLPVRERYVHVLDAKSRPEHFFGDPGLRLRNRTPLSPDAVELFEMTDYGSEGSRTVSLADAKPNEFYVFKNLRKGSGEAAKEHVSTGQSKRGILAEPHYQRIIDHARWKKSCLHPTRLYACETRRFNTSVKPCEVVGLDPHDRLWWYDGANALFGTLQYEATTSNFKKKTCISRLPSQKGIGINYVQTAYSLSGGFEGVLLVGERHFAFSRLQDQHVDGVPFVHDDFYAASATQGKFFQNFYCLEKAAASLWLTLSTGSIVMEAKLSLHVGQWKMREVHSFSARHPVTSLCAIDHGCDEPCVILSGLRNGTIQIIPLQTKCASYDSTSRHHDAEISFLYPLPYTEHQFISVASNVETKVWDLRYFSCKQPVAILHQGTRFGVHGDLSASVCNGLVAISSPTLGIRCIEFNTRNVLFETSDSVPTGSTILLHQVGVDYELYLFNANYSQRYFLRNDT